MNALDRALRNTKLFAFVAMKRLTPFRPHLLHARNVSINMEKGFPKLLAEDGQ